MQNGDTASERSWSVALRTFDASLRTHGLAEKTRRAYGIDLAQLADWASVRGLAPVELGARDLRRYAAVIS